MIGTSGRMLMNHPHGLEPVHSRHEDVEKQQVEIAGFEQREPFAAVAGGDHAVACAFEQQADGGLNRRIVIHDQYSCQVNRFSWSPPESGQRLVVNFAETLFSCNGFAAAVVPSVVWKMRLKTHSIRMLSGRQHAKLP